jgi:hypothetical protein
VRALAGHIQRLLAQIEGRVRERTAAEIAAVMAKAGFPEEVACAAEGAERNNLSRRAPLWRFADALCPTRRVKSIR